MWLRQSTASQEILLGRFVDSTDGNTEETALTINNTDIKLWKEGGTTLASKNSGGATHIANGLYYAVLDATDTDTLGKLEVHVHVSGALAVKREFMVLPAMIYDSLVLGTDRFDVNVTHAADTAWASGAITAAVIADGAIDRATFAADTGLQSVRSNTAQAGGATSITLDASASATTDFYKHCLIYLTGGTGVGQFRLCTAYNGTTKVATVTPAWATNPDATSTFAVMPSGLVNVEAFGGTAGTFSSGRPEVNTTHAAGTAWGSGAITSATFAAGAITATVIATDAIDADALAANAVTEIQAGLSTLTAADIRTAVGLASANLDTQLSAIDDYIDTEVAAIKTKTDFLPSATAGSAGGLLIAGSNAATTFATLTVSGATTLTGNVAAAAGVTITQSTLNGHGISVTGNGTGNGIYSVGGSTGDGLHVEGGGTSGEGIHAVCQAGNSHGIYAVGQGSGEGIHAVGGATGAGIQGTGGATSGSGIAGIATSDGAGIYGYGGVSGPGIHGSGGGTSGDGLLLDATSGNGATITASGTSMHGVVITGGSGGTSDGLKLVAGTGGVGFRLDTLTASGAWTVTGGITTNITGNLSGSIGSVSSGGITAASIATGAVDADAIATDAVNEIADAILSRNVSNVEGSAGEHTLCTVVLGMLENSISGTTLTIKRTDGTTTHATKTLTKDAAAEPITGIS